MIKIFSVYSDKKQKYEHQVTYITKNNFILVIAFKVISKLLEILKQPEIAVMGCLLTLWPRQNVCITNETKSFFVFSNSLSIIKCMLKLSNKGTKTSHQPKAVTAWVGKQKQSKAEHD